MPPQFRAPSLLLTAAESRAFLEFGAMLAARPLLARAARGDNRPVVVLPGFLAGDVSTRPMRRFLENLGHDVHGWGLGRNWGPSPGARAGLRQRVLQVTERTGQPAALVGWSLGGIYARHLAKLFPDRVRQVVTLASPFRMSKGDRSRVSEVYRAAAGHHHVDFTPMGGDYDLGVPATSLFTKTDGVIDWRACLDRPGPEAENIEVRASHFGIGYNPVALFVLADRLAQNGAWQPFRPPPWMDKLVSAGES